MLFSIVIPVYNSEDYLSTAIDSVITQTLNFEQHTEIILIDDGSVDNTRQICLEFTKRFPNNIKYIYTKNQGPAAARNLGINSICKNTRYIGFLDADDYFSPDTLDEVNKFFENNSDIELTVIPVQHFGRINTPHRLNYRFEKGNRKINILKEYKNIHFQIGGCFFRAKHFLENKNFRFQTDLRFWEDALLINKFLLKHKKYGVASKPVYYYRKHIEKESLVSNAWYQKSRYTKMLKECYQPLVEDSKKLYGKILPYVQFLIIYHLRHYFFKKNNKIIYEVLNQKEQEEFFLEFKKLIQQFEDKYIYQQNMPFYYKKYFINLKNHKSPTYTNLDKVKTQNVKITKIKFCGSHWIIEGNFKNKEYMMSEKDQLFIQKGKKMIFLSKKTLPSKLVIIWGTTVRNYRHAGFTGKIPLNFIKFRFGLKTKAGQTILLNNVNLIRTLFQKLNHK